MLQFSSRSFIYYVSPAHFYFIKKKEEEAINSEEDE